MTTDANAPALLRASPRFATIRSVPSCKPPILESAATRDCMIPLSAPSRLSHAPSVLAQAYGYTFWETVSVAPMRSLNVPTVSSDCRTDWLPSCE
ncbi:hypothetical protein D3C85_1145810 [compost metagenome]